jgi:tRNA modification GTPase
MPAVFSADTIVAQSTAIGRSAIAVVRLSGSGAHEIALRHVDPFPTEARRAELVTFRGADGEVVDHVLITRFDAPHSYTGEDLVELSSHGGLVGPARIVEQLLLSGARLAEPGEFTRRAVLNGKLDLLQAEAVGDLIDARSRAMHRAAIHQLDRGLTRRVEALREAILDVEALLAYDIDFPEEDDGPIPRERILAAAIDVLSRIDQLLSTAPTGELLREGAMVVIAGPPNVGKSSLFNALLGRARAIVTEIPGTTRDAIEAVIEGARWPIRLIDTAGLRRTVDPVERLGVELSERHVLAADVVLACGDDANAMGAAVSAVAALGSPGTVLPVRTKADLANGDRELSKVAELQPAATVSAETGAGIRELLSLVEFAVGERVHAPEPDAPVLTHARHRHALETARSEVAAFIEAWKANELPATVAATHLRSAATVLAELIGSVDVEAVLERVFAKFCVGK